MGKKRKERVNVTVIGDSRREILPQPEKKKEREKKRNHIVMSPSTTPAKARERRKGGWPFSTPPPKQKKEICQCRVRRERKCFSSTTLRKRRKENAFPSRRGKEFSQAGSGKKVGVRRIVCQERKEREGLEHKKGCQKSYSDRLQKEGKKNGIHRVWKEKGRRDR